MAPGTFMGRLSWAAAPITAPFSSLLLTERKRFSTLSRGEVTENIHPEDWLRTKKAISTEQPRQAEARTAPMAVAEPCSRLCPTERRSYFIPSWAEVTEKRPMPVSLWTSLAISTERRSKAESIVTEQAAA